MGCSVLPRGRAAGCTNAARLLLIRPCPLARRCCRFRAAMEGFSQLGTGIGLRPPHYADVAAGRARVDWLEVITENFMVEGGNPRRVLRAVRDRYPVVLHGVSMSLGSVDPLDDRYLDGRSEERRVGKEGRARGGREQ